MEDETRRYLTEKVLGECWHSNIPTSSICCKCRDVVSVIPRTFDNHSDMMDLYQAIEKAGKWINFLNWVFNDLEEPYRGDSYYSTASIAWLFCLSGEGYEDRCKMVAEFWGEAKDD